MIAGEEKLHRIEILEQLFEAAIVEKLSRFTPSARREHNLAVIGNPVGISWYRLDTFLGVKEREQAGARPHHLVQPLDHGLQQGRTKELQGVPNQHTVELKIFKADGVLQEPRHHHRIGLVLVEVAVTETVVELMQKIVGVE